MSRNQRINHTNQPEYDRDNSRNENLNNIRLENPTIQQYF